MAKGGKKGPNTPYGVSASCAASTPRSSSAARPPEASKTPFKRLLPLFLVLAYVAVVHTVDTLAHQHVRFLIDWRMFRWQLHCGFDVFEFVFWLVIPVLFMARRLEVGYFGFCRWKRGDWILFVVLVGVGVLAILAIPLFPSLRETYRGMGGFTPSAKWAQFRYYLIWDLSWLVGWEFIHRCAMTIHLRRCWPRYGWLLVPLAEGLYHLQKPVPEMLGMVAFSILATQWTIRRRNMMLPFLVHLAIELELVAFLLLV